MTDWLGGFCSIMMGVKRVASGRVSRSWLTFFLVWNVRSTETDASS